MTSPRQRWWILRGLDPASALCEMTCGLVMTLTIMLTAGYYVEGSDTPGATLLTAAIGCTLAWGVIDGLLYVMSDLYAQSRRNQFLRTLHAEPANGRAVLFSQARDDFEALLSDAQMGQLVDAVSEAAMRLQPESPRFTRKNLNEMVTTVFCNVLALVPAVLPFVLLPGNAWQHNLRISNGLIVAMMFGVGAEWGKAVGLSPWRTGAAMLAMGVTMVSIAVVLGG
jgi:hypothetical protein